jgi:hypothetical protein
MVAPSNVLGFAKLINYKSNKIFNYISVYFFKKCSSRKSLFSIEQSIEKK